jgi:glutaredoxin-related protein
MPREVLDSARIHPAIQSAMGQFGADILKDVRAAIAAHDIVVVGMRQNPFPKRARQALDAAGLPYHYLEYGSYFSEWRRRLALKMWTGWPTFPMVFVKGTFVGGASDVQALIASGDMQRLLAAKN